MIRSAVLSICASLIMCSFCDDVAGRQAAGALLINEVLYDPEGADSGSEFVELINAGSVPVSLEGWSLLAGDGARRSRWSVLWRGAAADTIHPGDYFLISGAGCPGADSQAELELQNGPDGCALAFDGRTADLVGWGEHQYPEYYEGAPAPDVPSGASLARKPDGTDTDDNRSDFAQGSPPTPGSANFPSRGLSLVGGRLEVFPANPEVGEAVRVRAAVVSPGIEAGAGESFEFEMDVTEEGSGLRETLRRGVCTISFEDTVSLDGTWAAPHRGLFEICCSVMSSGEASGGADTAASKIRAGPGPLIVSEMMYDPEDGGEWIELSNAGGGPIALRGWTLEDKAGARIEMTGGLPVDPGAYVVVAEDSAALVRRFDSLGGSEIVGSYVGRWPALNNSDGPDGVADCISVADSAGAPSDIASYSGRMGGRRGVSLERLRRDLTGRRLDNWHSSVAPEGATPGRANSSDLGGAQGGSPLTVDPAFASVGGPRVPAGISYNLPFRPSALRISVYSMGGGRVAALVDRNNAPARGGLLWDGTGDEGRALAPGAYIVLLAGDGPAGERVRAKAVVVVKR